MRILHLSAQKPDSTGSGVYLYETVAALDRKGHRQAVIAGIAPEDNPSFPSGIMFRPVRFETDDLPFPVVGMSNVMPYRATRYMDLTPEMTDQFKAAFSAAVNEVLDMFHPDLIICHHLYLLCGVMAHLVRKRAVTDGSLKACVLCGLSHSTDIRQMRQIPLERDFIAEGVRMLDRVYALHNAQAEEIMNVYNVDKDRIRVVGTGYNAQVFNNRSDARNRADIDRYAEYVDDRTDESSHGNADGQSSAQLVYVGKIGKNKGIESLLKALERVAVHVPNVQLVLVGGYSNEQEYREIVQYAEAQNLPARFAGWLDQEELVREYNRADVFVLPSFYEGMPLVTIEALACGCKVVVTDLPGLRPWMQGNVSGGFIDFVEPPRMRNVDTPFEEDLPAFEARLAQSIERAIATPSTPCDTSRASWDALADRLL